MFDDTTHAEEPRRAKCPICGRPTEPAHKPFCSRRCADVDLHRWLSGVYRVPTEERPTDADAADPEERN
jgi:endogenous inhibitor of DNA gyrase (YacG/DUF329 family)